MKYNYFFQNLSNLFSDNPKNKDNLNISNIYFLSLSNLTEIITNPITPAIIDRYNNGITNKIA